MGFWHYPYRLMNWSRLFPPAQDYTGPKIPYYFLVLITIVSTARSLVHLFAADGGAGVIAGIDIRVEGGMNIIAMFGQWGASQLILAIIFWLVILRYRSFTPLMLMAVVLEQLLRMGVGQIKPLYVTTPPPGAIGSQIILPLALIALVWSIWPDKNQHFLNSDHKDIGSL